MGRVVDAEMDTRVRMPSVFVKLAEAGAEIVEEHADRGQQAALGWIHRRAAPRPRSARPVRTPA